MRAGDKPREAHLFPRYDTRLSPVVRCENDRTRGAPVVRGYERLRLSSKKYSSLLIWAT